MIGNNHKGETLYVWGEYPDWKWVELGDKETQPMYQGQVKDGKRNGQGTFTWSDFGVKYEGGWKEGKKHGQGIYSKSDGGIYEGEFKDGEYDGQGTFTFSWGDKYVGEWKNGENWNGTQYDKDGNITKKYVNGY